MVSTFQQFFCLIWGLSLVNPFLFVFCLDSQILYLLVYVEDMILTGMMSVWSIVILLILMMNLMLRTWANLAIFLGMEPGSHLYFWWNFFGQTKYICSGYSFSCLDVGIQIHLLPYRLLVNLLRLTNNPLQTRLCTVIWLVHYSIYYLTITLAYVVNPVSQFLQCPTNAHFQAVKGILRYVKGALDSSLRFTRSSKFYVVRYSDAEWARCPDTSCSTYGYSVFFSWR